MTEVIYTVGGTPEDTFAVPFEFWLKDDLTVMVGTVTTIAFVPTGMGDEAGGQILLDAPVSNTTVSIERTISCDRLTDFPIYGEFRVEALNQELDRLTAKTCDISLDVHEPTVFFNDISALLADTDLTGLQENTIVTTRLEPSSFIVDDSDFDVTTAGGLNLRATNVVSDYILEQFGGDVSALSSVNQAALIAAEARNEMIDLRENTYTIDDWAGTRLVTTARLYRNGAVTSISNGYTANFDNTGNLWRYRPGQDTHLMGSTEISSINFGGAAPLASLWTYGTISMGWGCLYNATAIATGTIAIGKGSMANVTTSGEHNLAIGAGTLAYASNADGGFAGGRNLAVGSLALHFTEAGSRNVMVGRDAGHSITDGNYNVGVGYKAAVGGRNPVGYTGGIEMQFGGNPTDRSVAVGYNALQYNAKAWNTGIGDSSLSKLKTAGSNVGLGKGAGEFVDNYVSWDDTVAEYDLSIAFTYTATASTADVVLASLPDVGVGVGYKVGLGFDDGSMEVPSHVFTISAVSGNTITVENPTGVAGSGSGSMWSCDTLVAVANTSASNVLLGREAAQNRTSLGSNVVVGNLAFQGASVDLANEYSTNNVLVGSRAGLNMTKLTNSAFVGFDAGRYLTSGSETATVDNSSGLGSGSRVDGDNEVQLGDSNTTPYAYAALQIRSDERDKADIAASSLGLDFILGVVPIEYHLDMRDDYILDMETVPEGWWSNPVKDGSKKRERLHQGVSAQQVRDLCTILGVDFSGLQDRSVNGGSDTLTISYETFVPPLIKAVQELEARISALEGS